MTIGAGIAIDGIWLSTAAIILGYQKTTKKMEMTPFGAALIVVLAIWATAYVAKVL